MSFMNNYTPEERKKDVRYSGRRLQGKDNESGKCAFKDRASDALHNTSSGRQRRELHPFYLRRGILQQENDRIL